MKVKSDQAGFKFLGPHLIDTNFRRSVETELL